MLSRLKQLISQPDVADAIDASGRVQRAAAALLIEVARADFNADPAEIDSVRAALSAVFELDERELDELIDDVCREVEQSGSLHPYTSLIHGAWDEARKIELMRALWRVAFADGRVDRYEEHILRRIADLLYLRHQDFIRSKHAAEQDAEQDAD